MIVVVDASVAIKWFFRTAPQEDHSEKALRLLEEVSDGRTTLCQPVHFVAEVAAVISRLDPHGALENLNLLLEIDCLFHDGPEIYSLATELAIRRKHHLFDTLYHAVALSIPGAIFVTADRRYYDKTRAEGQILLLPDWNPAS